MAGARDGLPTFLKRPGPPVPVRRRVISFPEPTAYRRALGPTRYDARDVWAGAVVAFLVGLLVGWAL